MSALVVGTRVILHLPVNVDDERDERPAARKIIGEIENRYKGITHSRVDSPMFIGRWENESGEFITDELVIVMFDIMHKQGNDTGFLVELNSLKAFVFRSYDEVNSHQDELWLLTQPIQLILKDERYWWRASAPRYQM